MLALRLPLFAFALRVREVTYCFAMIGDPGTRSAEVQSVVALDALLRSFRYSGVRMQTSF